MENVKRVIQAVLEKEFADVNIDSIELRESEDIDENDVLYVTVVFRSSGPLNSRAKAGFVRHVRPKLHEVHEDRFPVMSFVSSDDFRGKLAETA